VDAEVAACVEKAQQEEGPRLAAMAAAKAKADAEAAALAAAKAAEEEAKKVPLTPAQALAKVKSELDELRQRKKQIDLEAEAIETEITVKMVAREVEKMKWAIGSDRQAREAKREEAAYKQMKLQELRYAKAAIEDQLESTIEEVANAQCRALAAELAETKEELSRANEELLRLGGVKAEASLQVQQSQMAASARLNCVEAELQQVNSELAAERAKSAAAANEVAELRKSKGILEMQVMQQSAAAQLPAVAASASGAPPVKTSPAKQETLASIKSASAPKPGQQRSFDDPQGPPPDLLEME